MGDGAYSYSLTTFSNSGKLIQIEHALRCVQEKGKMTVGICATDGVVLATTKKLSPLIDPGSFLKVCEITPQIGVCYSGMSPDYRVLLTKARKQAQVYYRKYQDRIPVLQLTKKTAEVMQEYTQQGGVRPFGVSLLIAGYDENGPQLYQADASGAYFQWNATAIGKKFVNAKSFLEKRLFSKSDDVTYNKDSAVDEAIRCLRQESEEELKETDIEIAVVDKDGFKLVPAADIKTILENMN